MIIMMTMSLSLPPAGGSAGGAGGSGGAAEAALSGSSGRSRPLVFVAAAKPLAHRESRGAVMEPRGRGVGVAEGGAGAAGAAIAGGGALVTNGMSSQMSI